MFYVLWGGQGQVVRWSGKLEGVRWSRSGDQGIRWSMGWGQESGDLWAIRVWSGGRVVHGLEIRRDQLVHSPGIKWSIVKGSGPR